MTKENFEIALQFLFPSEGGYVNDKDDKGGPTNMGVTQSTYNSYRKRKGLPQKDIKYITKTDAVNIYYEDYWKPSGADNISDPNMAVTLFDTAVLHGPYRAKQYYEQSNGDLDKFLNIRQKSYDKIVANDPSQKKYYQGWNNRVNNLRKNINSNTFTKQTYNTQSTQTTLQDLSNKNNYTEYSTSNQNGFYKLRAEYNYNPINALPQLNDLMIDPLENNNNTQQTPFSFIDIPMADPVNNPTSSLPNQHIFTPEEIGKMSNQEFSQNEAVIMEQLRNGQLKNQPPKLDYENYKNPESGNKKVFTREDIENMTADEYSKYEKEIMAQVKNIGIPYKKDLPHNSKTNYSSNSKDGKWVTINGNHVFIED